MFPALVTYSASVAACLAFGASHTCTEEILIGYSASAIDRVPLDKAGQLPIAYSPLSTYSPIIL
jgi:hypothetical protein